jgi:type I restriction enzyme S subunit
MREIYKNPLPEGWCERPLREISIRKRGYSWDKDQETEIPGDDKVPVLRIPNIQESLNLNDLLYLRGVHDEALKLSGVSKDWIIFVASNGNPDRIGDSALIKENQEMVFGSFLQGITTKDPSILLPEFLASWMRIHNVHEAFSKTSQQTTGLGNLSWGAVKKLPVRFPENVIEQQSIIEILHSTDDVIEQAKEELEAARRLKIALMQQLFTRGIPGKHRRFKKIKYGFIPENWDSPKLKEIAKIDSGITLNQDRNPRKNVFRYLTVVNVHRENIILDEERYLELWENEIPGRLLMEKDILVVEGHANSSEIGRAAMVGEECVGMAYQNHLFRVRVIHDEIDPYFLLFTLNSERVRRHWNAICNTSSGLNTINHRQLGNLVIPKPDPEEQGKIVEIVLTAKENIAAIEHKLKALGEVKKSLLQNLLTGKVRVNAGAPA